MHDVIFLALHDWHLHAFVLNRIKDVALQMWFDIWARFWQFWRWVKHLARHHIVCVEHGQGYILIILNSVFLVLTLCGVCCAWLVAPDWGELHCRATRNLKVNTMTPWRRNTHRNIHGTQDSREHQGSGSRASHSNLPASCINLVCITTRKKIGAIECRDPRCGVLWWCDGATLRCKNCTTESNACDPF